MYFKDLNLSDELFQGITSNGFEECTPIQAATIPDCLKGKDISGLAQTGTGKTAAFLVPLMERVFMGKLGKNGFSNWQKGQFCLIMVPTRELAEQVYQDFYSFKGATVLDAVQIYGGTTYDRQNKMIKQGVEFIISTPGRLIDLYKSHSLDLRQCRAIVFDEADKMFDMGFKDDMQFLLHRIPRNRQLMFFSATMDFSVINMAYKFGASPIEIDLSKKHVRTQNVDDYIYHIGESQKPQYLLSVLNKLNPKQTIVFSNFKHKIEVLEMFLNKNGITSTGISSLLTQQQRKRVMDQFRNHPDFNVLVATDVAARGLDIENVDLVINYELADNPENYIHRIGRTGRAKKIGVACSLVSDLDVPNLLRVEEYLASKLKTQWLEKSDLIEDFVTLDKVKQDIAKKKYKPTKKTKKPKTRPKKISKKTSKAASYKPKQVTKSFEDKRINKKVKKKVKVRKGRSGKSKKGVLSFIDRLKGLTKCFY